MMHDAAPTHQRRAGTTAGKSAAQRAPGTLTVEGNQVAVDGQTLRGSLERGSGQSPMHMVSAYLVEAGFTLGSQAFDEKRNEIMAIPDLKRSLNLRGATVTIDAMGSQREIAATAREVGAHCQLQVKEHQPKLLHNIKDSMAEATRRPRTSRDCNGFAREWQRRAWAMAAASSGCGCRAGGSCRTCCGCRGATCLSASGRG
jgi:hypothetical protein